MILKLRIETIPFQGVSINFDTNFIGLGLIYLKCVKDRQNNFYVKKVVKNSSLLGQ